MSINDYAKYKNNVVIVEKETIEGIKIREKLEFKFDSEKEINKENHIVFICTNPSVAGKSITDPTVDELILITLLNGLNGFTLFNLSPIQLTKIDKDNFPEEIKKLPEISKQQSKKESIDCDNKQNDILTEIINSNVEQIKNYLENNEVKAVVRAWGNLSGKGQYIGLFVGEEKIKKVLDDLDKSQKIKQINLKAEEEYSLQSEKIIFNNTASNSHPLSYRKFKYKRCAGRLDLRLYDL